MELLKLSILVILLVMSGIPMKNGNLMKKRVTPTCPSGFAEFMEKQDKKNKERTFGESSMVEEMNLAPDNVNSVEDTTSAESRTGNNSNFPNSNSSSHPVCKYGMAEIFLFGHSADSSRDDYLTKQAPSEKSDAIKPQEEKTPDPGVIAKEEKLEKKSDTEGKNDTFEAESEPQRDAHVNLEVSDMQSFEEWKNLKLQEQETRLAESEPIPSHVLRAKKTQVNYASQDCGAKILGSNKEAKHMSAILDENKDMYMLNPCSTSIWFVIELCEPIQVQQLQLGNLELFSSAPREFSVSISERYPAREWHSLGIFEATNDRNLQTFAPNAESQMFAKYIKFEMLSHFSNEHFCPLTLVRVLGVSMVDEFDETEKEGDTDYEENRQDTSTNEASEGEKTGEGPINTVLNIVKTAMGLSNGERNDHEDQLADAKSNNSGEAFDNGETEGIDPSVESEVVLVINETEVAVPAENMTRSLITLIETGKGEELTEYLKNLTSYSPREIPLYIPKFIHFLTPKINVNMCWFLEFFCKVSLASCLVHYPYNYSAMGLFLPIANVANYLSLASDTASFDDDSSVSDTKEVTHMFNEHLKIDNAIEGTVNGKAEDDSTASHNKIKMRSVLVPGESTSLENKASNSEKSDGSQVLSARHASKEETEGSDKSDQIDKSKSRPLDDDVRTAERTREKDVVSTTGDEEESDREDTEQQSRDNNEVFINNIRDTTKTPNYNETRETLQELPVENATRNASSIDAKPATNDSTSESPSPQPSVVINPGTNQKDSVLMRLSNRIRVLEQNMSLSSDYLENLSQRFKKQMDEMQRAFDHTTSKLFTTGRTADENDARQTELIHQAEAEIRLLKQQVQNLSLTHDKLNFQLVERHVCLIVLEIIIFTAILITCLGRRIVQIRCDLQKSEAMIENLQRIIQDIKQGTPVKANGHCAAIALHCVDRKDPPDAAPVVKHFKRQKKRCAQKQKDFLKYGTGKLEPHQASTGSLCVVEDIGNEAGTAELPLKGGEEKHHSWNGNALATKITDGHVKGRK